jgi:hypothetical protein
MKNPLILAVIALVIGVAAGFFGGLKYQSGKAPAGFTRGQFTAGDGRSSGFGGNGINRPIYGSIVSADAGSITVKLQDGSSKIAILSSTTQINKAAQGTASDLQPGQTVSVIGQTNSDGSVTAQNIQLNPRIPNTTPRAGQ